MKYHMGDKDALTSKVVLYLSTMTTEFLVDTDSEASTDVTNLKRTSFIDKLINTGS